MIAPHIEIVDASLIPALRDYAAHQLLKGKSIIQTFRRVMRYWVNFAISRVKPGDAAKIERRLSQIITAHQGTRKARGKYADRWRGTLAAALVRALVPSSRQLKGAAFYRKVNSFVNKAKTSANHHKRGFRPAAKALRSAGIPGPTLSHPAGIISETATDQMADILVENFARSHPTRFNPSPAGVGGLDAASAAAFTSALPDIIRMVEGFLQADNVNRAAIQAGFAVNP